MCIIYKYTPVQCVIIYIYTCVIYNYIIIYYLITQLCIYHYIMHLSYTWQLFEIGILIKMKSLNHEFYSVKYFYCKNNNDNNNI